MRHEIKKITKIVDELTTFCLERNAEHITVTVKNKQDREYIKIKAYPFEKIEEVIDNLKQVFSYPCEREIEECYWGLAGESDHSEELGLVGAMVDEVTIEYDEEKIQIELVRFKKV